jgi:hypothetical protein
MGVIFKALLILLTAIIIYGYERKHMDSDL